MIRSESPVAAYDFLIVALTLDNSGNPDLEKYMFYGHKKCVDLERLLREEDE